MNIFQTDTSKIIRCQSLDNYAEVRGGPLDGSIKVRPPDDGQPHAAWDPLHVTCQSRLPDFIEGSIYRWDLQRKLWVHVLTDYFHRHCDIDAELRRVNERGERA